MGMMGLTRSAASSFAKYDIRCVLISPGHVDTPFIRDDNNYSPNGWETSIENPENYYFSQGLRFVTSLPAIFPVIRHSDKFAPDK